MAVANLDQVGPTQVWTIAEGPRCRGISPGPQGSVFSKSDRIPGRSGNVDPIAAWVRLPGRVAPPPTVPAPLPDNPIAAESDAKVLGAHYLDPITVRSHLLRRFAHLRRRPSQLAPMPERAVRQNQESPVRPLGHTERLVGVLERHDYRRWETGTRAMYHEGQA